MVSRYAFLAVAAVLFLPATARALVMERVAFADLVRESDLVVVGTVTGSSSRHMDAPQERRIVTDVTVRVSDVVRGVHDGGEVVVTTLGGVVDGRGQIVPGAPRFAVGDEVVLFLSTVRRTASGKAVRLPVALSQGVFFVRRTPGGRPVATPRLDDVRLVPDGGMSVPAPAADGIDLDDLKARVRAVPAIGPAPDAGAR